MGTASHSKATSEAQEAGVPLEVLYTRRRFPTHTEYFLQAYFDSKLSSDTPLEDALAFLDQTKTDYAVHEQLAIVIHKVSPNPPNVAASCELRSSRNLFRSLGIKTLRA